MRTWVLILVSVGTFQAVAKNVEPQPNPQVRSLSSKPLICPKLNELKVEFGTTLNPAIPKDFEKGEDELIEARDCLFRFEAQGGRVEDPMFTEMIQLVAVALPFDVETDIADLLSNIIKTPKSEAVFQSELTKVPDVCRRNLLLDSVYARICESHPKNPNCSKMPPQDETCIKRLSPPESPG